MKKSLVNIKELIGNTPLVQITYRFQDNVDSIYTKVESYNFTGSVKDRMAYYILETALERGDLKEGMEIVEATSGNTGISFSALGAYLGIPVTIFMPDWMSEERKRMISSFGARIIPVSREEGGFLGSIAFAKSYDEKPAFLPSQFENEDNVLGQYESLGKELVAQCKALNLTPQGFVAGVGTGGTVMGVGKALRENFGPVRISPLEPKESPVLTVKEHTGVHRIAGISDEFVPPICRLNELDDIISISDGDSIIAAQMLAKSGLGVGISSGANFLGAIMMKQSLGKDSVVVTVFPDDNKKYLTTDLTKEEKIKEDDLSKDVEILDITFQP